MRARDARVRRGVLAAAGLLAGGFSTIDEAMPDTTGGETLRRNTWRILVPVDLSAASEASAAYAVEVARGLKAEVAFLFVVAESSLAGRILFARTAPEEEPVLTETERGQAEKRLRAFLEPLSLEGLPFSTLVEKGVPHERILQAVDRLKPDLVVQGTHGSKGVEERIIGGTAERIIRRTRCPVISVKPREFGSFLKRVWSGISLLDGRIWAGAPPREAYRFPPAKILYATDFSEASRLAAAPALNLARATGAELMVLHVAPEGPEEPPADEPGAEGDDPRLAPREEMERLVQEMIAYQKGVRIVPRILQDDSISRILSTAIEEEVDLLVMGTRGLSGWELVLNGSTADYAIHNAPCPVLTVRPNWKLEKLGRKFRRVFRSLSAVELRRMSSSYQGSVEEDLLGSPSGMKRSELFLNYYSPEGIRTALEEYGILDRLRGGGLDGFRVWFDLEEPYRHKMRVYLGEQEGSEHLLMELIVREGVVQTPEGLCGPDRAAQRAFPVLVVDWICMQNPRAVFSSERPPLPGQEHPGLGIGYEIYQMLVQMALRLGRQGLMNRPQHYHNAKFYHEMFKFLDPVREGRLIALIRDTEDGNLADVSWAVYHGCLLDAATGETVPWEGGILICPLSNPLRRYFASRAYHDVVWETVANTSYRVDWSLFRERMRADPRAQVGGAPPG